MKKILSITFFVIFLCIVLPFTAHADGIFESDVQKNELYSVVNNGVLNGESSIDISIFNISTSDIDNIINTYVWENPEYSFCITSRSYRHSNGNVISLNFQYDNTSTIRARHEHIDEQLSEIVSYMNPDLNNIEKIAWINDYICDTFQYDIVTEYHTIDKLLETERGICEAYANLFTALCRKIGLKSSYCYSNEIQHIWNVVELNGQWYHIDTTWNDSYAERYEYFLLSENEMRTAIAKEKGNNFQMNSPYQANSTIYDNAFWRDSIYSSFERVDETSYVVKNWKLYSINWSSLSLREEATLNNEKWSAPGGDGTYYVSCFTDIEAVGNTIFYTTPNGIRKYNLDTKKDDVLYNSASSLQVVSIRITPAGFEIRCNGDLMNDITSKKTINGEKIYTVEYVVCEKICYVQFYLHGDKMSIPTKVYNHSSTVLSWSLTNGQIVTANLINTATVSTTSSSILVQFKVDDKIIKQETLTIGDLITPPGNPTKESDVYNHYLFIEWVGYKSGMKAVEGEYIFYALFSEIKRTYNVSFYSDGKLITEHVVDAGTNIEFPEVPSSIVKNGITYKFVGWNTNKTTVSETMIINAVYAESDKKCTITYYVDGTVFYKQTVNAGDILKYPELHPVKENDKYSSFVFDGWIGGHEGDYVMNDLTLTASFHAEPLPDHMIEQEQNTTYNKTSLLDNISIGRVLVVILVVAVVVFAYYMLFKRNN